MTMIIEKGATDVSVELYIVDATTGQPEIGVVFNTAGIDLNYRRDGAGVTSIIEIDLTTPALTDAHEDGGFLEVANGRYRLDVPDAAFATGVDQVTVGGTVTGMVVIPVVVDLGVITTAKILAYLQLLVRKDNAIKQDNAAELLELNADGGSGGGAFLNETDALEALRDRGDLAWLTGGGGGATKSYTTTDWTRTVGDDDGGAGSDTATVDAVYFATGETNAGTLMEVDAVFTAVAGESVQALDFWGFYNGGGAHSVTVQAWDTTGSVWEPVGSMGLAAIVEKHTFPLSPSHIDPATGIVLIKFIHLQGVNGVASHVFNVDKAQINTSVPSTAADKLLAYIQLLVRSDAAIETDRATELGEINTDEGSGAGDFSSQTDSQESISDDLPVRPTKNVALANFPFVMVLTSDHVTGATGLTVVCQRSIDGAAYTNCTNTPATEVANGTYKISLSAADMNGDTIMLKFTSATADARFIMIATQPT